MIEKPYNYIYQINSYGCGVFAVMNAINYGMAKHGYGLTYQYHYNHIPILEQILETTEDFGTEEKHMVKFLRNYFYVTVRKKFSKKYLDKWLEKGHQAIIMYPYAGKYELHYSNVFKKCDTSIGMGYYRGANVWWKRINNSRWSMSRIMPIDLIKTMYKNEGLVIYLRWKERV